MTNETKECREAFERIAHKKGYSILRLIESVEIYESREAEIAFDNFADGWQAARDAPARPGHAAALVQDSTHLNRDGTVTERLRVLDAPDGDKAEVVEQIRRLLPHCRPAHVTHQIGRLLAALPPHRDDSGWQPIVTIPKDGTRVYLKNRKGEIDFGEWYPHGDEPGQGGINSVHGLGTDDDALGYSWWKPMEHRDDSGLVEEMVATLEGWMQHEPKNDFERGHRLAVQQALDLLAKHAARAKAGA